MKNLSRFKYKKKYFLGISTFPKDSLPEKNAKPSDSFLTF